MLSLTCLWRIDTVADFTDNRAAKMRRVSLSERNWWTGGRETIGSMKRAATKNSSTE